MPLILERPYKMRFKSILTVCDWNVKVRGCSFATDRISEIGSEKKKMPEDLGFKLWLAIVTVIIIAVAVMGDHKIMIQ